jgi:hypothetical protein
MKYKFIILTLSCLTLVYGFTIMGYMQNSEKNYIEVAITSLNETYSLGEVVPVHLVIKNIDSKEVTVYGDLDFAKLYISQDGKTYKECTNSARKRPDENRSPIKLSPNASILNNETILWNSDKQNVEYSWKERRVLTDYVFPMAGDYYIKAKYGIYVSSKPIFLESKPIKITVTEPKGEDLEVWNKIKDNGDFAYFIQYGDLLKPYDKTEQQAKFQTEVEQILTDYPNSFYATPLQQSLDKFRANEVRRQEFLQKAQNQKEKP